MAWLVGSNAKEVRYDKDGERATVLSLTFASWLLWRSRVSCISFRSKTEERKWTFDRKFDSDVKGRGRGYLEIVKASNHQGKVFKGICLLCSQAEGTVPKKKKKSRRLEKYMRSECTYMKIYYLKFS